MPIIKILKEILKETIQRKKHTVSRQRHLLPCAPEKFVLINNLPIRKEQFIAHRKEQN